MDGHREEKVIACSSSARKSDFIDYLTTLSGSKEHRVVKCQFYIAVILNNTPVLGEEPRNEC